VRALPHIAHDAVDTFERSGPQLSIVAATRMLAALLAATMSGKPPLVTIEAARACVTRLGPTGGERTFILGSQSASRRALLGATGARFDVLTPSIDEAAIGDRERDAPTELVARIALAKADALLERLRTSDHPSLSVPTSTSILLTGDQVVTFAGAIREKPRDRAEARAMIESYGRDIPCATVQAICLHDLATGARVLGHSTAEVLIAPIPEAVIEQLLLGNVDGHGDVMDCAGALMIEHPEVAPRVISVLGGLDSVMGLSTKLLVSLLAELQAKPPLCSYDGLRPGGARKAVLEQRTWAVVGDGLNPQKPAFRIVERLLNSGREVRLVNPRDSSGAVFQNISATFESGAAPVDAVNLVISPALGKGIVEQVKKLTNK